MRTRYSTEKQAAGRYPTPAAIANLMACSLPAGGRSLLELGAGEGALLRAMAEQHPELTALAVEIDGGLATGARRAAPGCRVVVGDVLDHKVQARVTRAGPYDYVIGNPPYAVAAERDSNPYQMKQWCLDDPNRGMRLDAFFIALSLSQLRVGGAAGFVLPLAFFTDKTYAGFRERLLARFAQIQVHALPAKLFEGAEVATAICILTGTRSRACKVDVGTADEYGRVRDSMRLTEAEALQRMDHTYHHEMRQLKKELGARAVTLKDIGATVVRGSRTSAEFGHAGVEHLHTTDLPVRGVGRFRYSGASNQGFCLAKTGDIVVPRVGTRCLLRQAIVERGATPFTESLYRVRAEPSYRKAILAALEGPIGERWRSLHASGSCAKHLRVADVLSMPLAV